MTMDKIRELIENYIDRNYKNPTILIVQKKEFEQWVSEMLNLTTRVNSISLGSKVTIMGYNLRVIFATNLEEGEVIVA